MDNPLLGCGSPACLPACLPAWVRALLHPCNRYKVEKLQLDGQPDSGTRGPWTLPVLDADA